MNNTRTIHKRFLMVAITMLFLIGLMMLPRTGVTDIMPMSQIVHAEGAEKAGARAVAQGGNGQSSRQDAEDTATNMIDQIVHVVCVIVMIIGGLFCLVGIVKFAIAHAENQGPEQQKATLMLATGIILIILPMILDNIDFSGVARDAISQNVD